MVHIFTDAQGLSGKKLEELATQGTNKGFERETKSPYDTLRYVFDRYMEISIWAIVSEMCIIFV